MATTNFINGQTPIVAEWLNDADAHVYDQTAEAHRATNISYTHSGSSTVRTAQDKLGETISVKDTGAVGGSEESEKFQLAVDALSASGGTILIPAGDYSATDGSLIIIGNKAIRWQVQPNATIPTNLPGAVFKQYYGPTFIVGVESSRNGPIFEQVTGSFPTPDNEKTRIYHVDATLPDRPATDVNRDLIAYSYTLETDHHGPLGGEIRGIKGIVRGKGGQGNLRSAHVITEGYDGHTGDITGILSDVFHSDLSPGDTAVGKSAAVLGQVGAGISDGFSLRSRTSPSNPSGTYQEVKYGYRVQTGNNAVNPTIANFIGHGGGGGSLFRGLKSDTDESIVFDAEATGKLLAQAFRTNHLTVADDAVTTITPPCVTGFIAIFAEDTSANWLIRFFRVGASPAMEEVASGSSGASTTGTLTGTTGTDGFLTISAKTDGTMDIENRSGASRNITYLFIGRS